MEGKRIEMEKTILTIDGINIIYNTADQMINGTTMCRLYNKKVYDFLKTKQIKELVLEYQI